MRDVAERFWEKVQVGEPDECWWWQAGRDRDGYGVFGIDGRQWRAHRLAWVFTYGEIPKGLCVCHQCDEPGCVNPYHLFLGTNAANTADRDAKGRGRFMKGEGVGTSRLTEAQVLDIRRLGHGAGLSQREIGELFGVDGSTVGCVLRGETWGWLNKLGV